MNTRLNFRKSDVSICSSNSGNPFHQWDLGVKEAKGGLVWIAESDDFAESTFLEKSVKAMEENQNLGLVYCNSNVLDEQTNKEYLVSEKKKFFSKDKWLNDYSTNGNAEITDFMYLANIINNVSSVLFRRSTYIEAGLADHSFKFCGDWFLYVRMLLISDLAYIAEPLNTFRLHTGSTFNSYFGEDVYYREVKKIYSFITENIHLSAKKRFLMSVYLFRILSRRIINRFSRGYSILSVISTLIPCSLRVL